MTGKSAEYRFHVSLITGGPRITRPAAPFLIEVIVALAGWQEVEKEFR